MIPYRTVVGTAAAEQVIKKSRFIGSLYPIESAEQAQEILAGIRKQYWDASHHCYAYVLGPKRDVKKFSDDGEPQGTAGMPILDVLDKKELTNEMVVVVRYFGGTLLGAGGLVRAYGGTCAETVRAADIRVMTPVNTVELLCEYGMWNRLDRALNQCNVMRENVQFGADVTCILSVKPEDTEALIDFVTDTCQGQVLASVTGEKITHWPAADETAADQI